jgi:Uma2 family endonuclease
MVTQLITQHHPEILYPDSDGQPMADNTIQFHWINLIHHNLAWLFAENAQVFVAGDLLWYPVESEPKLRQAPDVMVVFGVSKGDRGSYQQWKENNIPPQVVFEIFSPGNTLKEMNRKLLFYDRYGVEEYYLYNPEKNYLSGWVRSNSWLDIIEEMDNWVSPHLGIRFQLTSETLFLYYPDGQQFIDYLEVQKKLQLAENRAFVIEKQLEQEQQRAKRLEELLRDAGIDPDHQ